MAGKKDFATIQLSLDKMRSSQSEDPPPPPSLPLASVESLSSLTGGGMQLSSSLESSSLSLHAPPSNACNEEAALLLRDQRRMQKPRAGHGAAPECKKENTSTMFTYPSRDGTKNVGVSQRRTPPNVTLNKSGIPQQLRPWSGRAAQWTAEVQE